MGKGFGAVLPIVVIRVIADLLVNRLLGIEIVGGLALSRGRWVAHETETSIQPVCSEKRTHQLETR